MGIVKDALTKAVDFVSSEIVPIKYDLMKAGLLKPQGSDYESKANLVDPYNYNATVYGYKEKFSILDYSKARQICNADPVISAIIQTRVNQVGTFAVPRVDRYKCGFKIKLRDNEKRPNAAQKKKIKEMERFIMNCGYEESVYDTPDIKKKDSFEAFLRKVTRDTLTFDQCLPSGTLIETNRGYIPIEDVVVGDVVTTHLGRKKRVSELKRNRFSGKMIEISCGGQKIVSTDYHPFLVENDPDARFRASFDAEWIPAGDVKKGSYLTYPKISLHEEQGFSFKIFGDEQRRYPNIPYRKISDEIGVHPSTIARIARGSYQKQGKVVNVVEDYLSKIGFELVSRSSEKVVLDESMARFLGLYVAEGNRSGNTCRLTINGDRDDLIRFVSDWFESLGVTCSKSDYVDRNAVTLIGNSSELANWMEEFCGKGSHHKRVPDFIFKAKDSIKKEFLAGYLSGDGSFDGARASFTTVSRELFSGIRLLCNHFGVFVKQRIRNFDSYGWSEQYMGTMSGETWRDIAKDTNLPCISLDRPREAYLQDENNYYLKVSSVKTEDVEDLEVFNIEVEEDNSYLANGFISHNCTFEVVPRRNGLPAKFMAVDAATIKILPDKREKQAIWGRGYDETTQVAQNYEAYNMKYADIKQRDAENPRYVQVVNGTPRAWFDEWEMAFGVRNPRTDLLSNGYGFSEVEMLLTTITAHINAETYNRKFFSQGSSQKGILSFTGQVPPDQLESFKRQWHQQVAGVQNAWRTPIVSGGKDSELKWINLHSTNKDMEWGKYVEYLIKTICGVYQIDPMEIGFDISRNSTGGSSNGGGIGGQGQQIERLKYSKDKGLDPLLRFIANMINEYVVWRLDPEFEFEFVGLNVVGEKEQIDLDKTKIETYKTINELRAEHDLPPLKDPTDIKNAGDLVMNNNFIQAYQSLSQAGMGDKMGGGMGMEGGGEMSPDGQMGGAQDQNQEEPDYENMSDEELQAELDKLQGGGKEKKPQETMKSFKEKTETLEIIL